MAHAPDGCSQDAMSHESPIRLDREDYKIFAEAEIIKSVIHSADVRIVSKNTTCSKVEQISRPWCVFSQRPVAKKGCLEFITGVRIDRLCKRRRAFPAGFPGQRRSNLGAIERDNFAAGDHWETIAPEHGNIRRLEIAKAVVIFILEGIVRMTEETRVSVAHVEEVPKPVGG